MIKPDDWKPIEVAALEPAALGAVTATGSTLVVAGPGTGKTELLGQRAAFLLQTGRCAYPRRILAISFKRDAASNLRERVEKRCGRALARQLDSYTFDAFAKQLLDRFWRALPNHLALSGMYKIGRAQPPRQGYGQFQLSVVDALKTASGSVGWAAQMLGGQPQEHAVHAVGFDEYSRGVQALCLEPLTASSTAAFLQLVALREGLIASPPSLTFPQIGILAAAAITANPMIRTALRATYSHVFLDEFQDTTSVQYALVAAMFEGSETVLTAVGDTKQRIMGWAGARQDVFEAFEQDFLSVASAHGRLSLTKNYRSNERIVAILNILKARLAPEEPDFVAVRKAPDLPDEEICSVLVADHENAEAEAVAKLVAEAIADGTDPRVIGLLVRQRAPEWEERLRDAFDRESVTLRNEDRDVGGATIQELMTEAYSRFLLDLLEFCSRKYGGTLWSAAMDHFAAAEGIEIDDDETAERALATRVDKFHTENRIDPCVKPEPDEVRARIGAIEECVGLDRLRSLAPQYATGDFFESIRKASADFLIECAEATTSWSDAIDRFRGIGQVPLLTITKSKGLEYDLVVLLGLNDDQWWSFDRNTDEGHSVFFVAASRARERLLMTRTSRDRNRKIEEIFDLLRAANVPERRV